MSEYNSAVAKAYENLANAVIVKAVRDYQHALIHLHFNPYNDSAYSRKKEVERFVHSDLCHSFTRVDGDRLLAAAAKQVEENGPKKYDHKLMYTDFIGSLTGVDTDEIISMAEKQIENVGYSMATLSSNY